MLLGATGLAGTALLRARGRRADAGGLRLGCSGDPPFGCCRRCSRARAAGGIALINTIGVSGGLFGPIVVGAAKDGSLEAGLGALGAVLTLGAALAARLPFAAPATAPQAA